MNPTGTPAAAYCFDIAPCLLESFANRDTLLRMRLIEIEGHYVNPKAIAMVVPHDNATDEGGQIIHLYLIGVAQPVIVTGDWRAIMKKIAASSA